MEQTKTSLLNIEWLKIKRYVTFWVILSLFAAFMVLWNYGIAEGFIRIGTKDFNLLSQAYAFPNVWDNMGFYASIFIVFPAIVVIILTTNEYQYRTNRQNVIDGWSRMQFYHAKWLVILSLSVASTVFVFLLGLIFGYSNSHSFTGAFDHIDRVFYFFILSVNYMGLGFLLSLLLKRSGLTIGLLLLYSMIVESILHMYFNFKLSNRNLNLFLPLQSSDDLLPLPLMDMAKRMAGAQSGPAPSSYVIASLCWIAVYYFIGRARLMRSDW